MPGPVIAAIQAQKRPREPDDAFSLALIATGAMGTPTVGTAAIWSSYVDDNRYTACHDIAAQLVDVLQTAPLAAPTAVGAGPLAPGVGQNNIGVGRFLKVDYGAHSFTLLNHAGVVECIEGWAGRPPFTVGQCLFQRADEILTDSGAAQGAFAGMLSPIRANRELAVDAISRAGLGGFGNTNVVPTLTISAYPLAQPATIAARYRALVNTALDWARDAREHQRGRFTCSACLEFHGWTRSWFGRTWGRCGDVMCSKVYCPTCKAGLLTFQFNGGNVPRCTCGHSVDDIDWSRVV